MSLFVQGHEVEITKRTRDGGKDLIVLFKNDVFGELMYYVECKKWKPTRPVGIDIVRAFYGVVDKSNANAGMVVTSSRFTKDAIRDNTDLQYNLCLKDFNDVFKWIENSVKKLRGH